MYLQSNTNLLAGSTKDECKECDCFWTRNLIVGLTILPALINSKFILLKLSTLLMVDWDLSWTVIEIWRGNEKSELDGDEVSI